MGSSDVIGRVTAHFQGQRRFIDIPEWADDAGEALRIFTTPITLHERAAIARMSGGDENEAICRTVILKAEDQQGEKMFTLENKNELMKFADSEILARIVQFMFEGVDQRDIDKSIEDLEKN